ncbi:MAG: SDR family oxidoreductase [Caldilineaceae bacterium]|nr:SDR family oxidoreductase [Caldilineaceae bacterium]
MADAKGWLGLEGRVAAVTGAASGVGTAIAEELAAAGARIVLLDINQNNLDAVADEFDKRGDQAVAIQCNVSNDNSVKSAADSALAAFGGVDILVNNAGILRPGDLANLSISDWDAMMNVNVTGYLRCAQAFGRPMLEKGKGAIVHISSIAASEPQAASGAYSPGKAAVCMLSRQMAFEWGPKGVRSNVVSPGLVRTPLSEAFYQAPGVLEARSKAMPLGRIAKTSDIAEAVAFFASDRASYVTGQEIVVDGGFSQTLMSHVPRPGY